MTLGAVVSALGPLLLGVSDRAAAWVVYLEVEAAVIAALGAVAVYFLRPLGARLGALERALTAAAAGDLSVIIHDRRIDQLGRMSAAFSVATGATRTALQDIQLIGASMRLQGREIEEIASTLSSSAENTVNDTLAAQAAAADVSANMDVVASANEEMAATVREIARSASDAASVAVAAARHAGVAGGSAESLVAEAEQLGQISVLIGDLARQTRLLAFNARIEASRSETTEGGFIVVAEEVRQLATHSSEATEQVNTRVAEIRVGSARVDASLRTIVSDLGRVTESQTAIASAVEQQLSTTSEISAIAGSTANGSRQIANNIATMSHTMRRIAYGGSQARNTATEVADLDVRLSRILAGFTLGERPESLDAAVATVRTSFRRGGTTVIPSDVAGTGLNEFEYIGSWCHSDTNESGDSDAYTSMPDDTATLRFAGTHATYVGVRDAHHGIAAVSIDGGLETRVDLYAPHRCAEAVWDSGTLRPGEHVLRIRATDSKNPESRYYWNTIDRVEIS